MLPLKSPESKTSIANIESQPRKEKPMALTGDSKLWRGIICTLAGGIGWGFSGACGQYLFSYQDVRPDWLTVIRMLIAGFLLCLPTNKR